MTPEPDAEDSREPVEPRRPVGPGPIGGDISSIVYGLGERFSIPALTTEHSSITIMGLFATVNGIISIAIMAGAAVVTGQPLIFPSLGPTAFLLFYTPTGAAASPHNSVFGHLIGVGAGYLALVVFGLTQAGPALSEGVTWPRVGAAAMSLGLTSGVMVWARVPHPPAGATTLIVSLGIISTPPELAVLMLAVVLLVIQGFVINRLAGIDYPVWFPKKQVAAASEPGG